VKRRGTVRRRAASAAFFDDDAAAIAGDAIPLAGEDHCKAKGPQGIASLALRVTVARDRVASLTLGVTAVSLTLRVAIDAEAAEAAAVELETAIDCAENTPGNAPTVKLDPAGKAAALVRISVPEETVTPPVMEFSPESVTVPGPVTTSELAPPLSLIGPAIVKLPAATFSAWLPPVRTSGKATVWAAGLASTMSPVRSTELPLTTVAPAFARNVTLATCAPAARLVVSVCGLTPPKSNELSADVPELTWGDWAGGRLAPSCSRAICTSLISTVPLPLRSSKME
jgi:hypothetical protein